MFPWGGLTIAGGTFAKGRAADGPNSLALGKVPGDVRLARRDGGASTAGREFAPHLRRPTRHTRIPPRVVVRRETPLGTGRDISEYKP